MSKPQITIKPFNFPFAVFIFRCNVFSLYNNKRRQYYLNSLLLFEGYDKASDNVSCKELWAILMKRAI
jgi:hypothetical protein